MKSKIFFGFCKIDCFLLFLQEPHEESLGECVECLSSLLSNGDDQVVADGALKCFASLADRFIRKNVDPVPLANHGLTQELLNRLTTAGLAAQSNAGAEAAKSTTASVSTTISLLSTLCRGSEAITHNLLRSNLAEAIESALQGDERCILDTMRLIDLLLVLLFEGKQNFIYNTYMLQYLTKFLNTILKLSSNCKKKKFCSILY